MKKLKVLSLFDGMSCGQIVLDELGFNSANKNIEYYASEIKPKGIQVTMENYPNTIELGDVTKVSFKDGILYSENGNFNVGYFDMVIGGSPCQNFSIVCIAEKRKGLEGEKSNLFYEYLRILKEVQPRFFFLENVASMKNEDRLQLDEYMGTKSIKFNSSKIGGVLRNRLYWTNIPHTPIEEKEILWSDLIDDGYVNKPKSPCLLEGHSRPSVQKIKLTRRYLEKSLIPVVFKDEEHYHKVVEHFNKHYRGKTAKEIDGIKEGINNAIYEDVRVLTASEMERLHGVPVGYTQSITRNEAASLLGDGWHVPTIKELFKGILLYY